MTEKELKKLSRAELLELLLIQTKETERLTKKLEKMESKLADRYLQMEKAGDLAHAVLEINGVMAAAQAAAQQYLDNIVQMEQETIRRCEEMLRNAESRANLIPQETVSQPESAASEQKLLGDIYSLLDEKNW